MVLGLPLIVTVLGLGTLFGSDTRWQNSIRSIFLSSRVKPHEDEGHALHQNEASNTGVAPDEVSYPHWRIRSAVIKALEEIAKAHLLKQSQVDVESMSTHKYFLEFILLGTVDDAFVVRFQTASLLREVCEMDPSFFKANYVPVIQLLFEKYGSAPAQTIDKKKRGRKRVNTKTSPRGSSRSPSRKDSSVVSLLDFGKQTIEQLQAKTDGPPHYFTRMLFLQFCANLVSYEEIWNNFEEQFLQGFADAVFNVRFEACVLAKDLPVDKLKKMSALIKKLSEVDPEQEVREVAAEALARLKDA